jgi:hypothetical protein
MITDIGSQLNVNCLVKDYIQQKDNEVTIDIMLVHARANEVIGKWTENLITDDLNDGMYNGAAGMLDSLDEDVLNHQFIYMPKSMYYAEIYWQAGEKEKHTGK